MKEIKQYLVVYWTLTSRTESLEVLFSNIRMYNKKLASCLNKI
ncbi:AAEL017354-PA [Aedes aegypti]|uniref:AAEL017354-PA n=1 Tax=Aedes aegypti TaxID=7159 RepID=J9HSF9_AEDAE|nr:AAEL017354-PA [Aedes aegypti]